MNRRQRAPRPIPAALEARVAAAIRVALMCPHTPEFECWAGRWLSGEDRAALPGMLAVCREAVPSAARSAAKAAHGAGFGDPDGALAEVVDLAMAAGVLFDPGEILSATKKVTVELFDPAYGEARVAFTADLPEGVSIEAVRRRLRPGYGVRPFKPGDHGVGVSRAHMTASGVLTMMLFGAAFGVP